MTYPISTTDRRRLRGYGALHALFADQTLDRFLQGLPVKDASATRIRAAAAALGIPLPLASAFLPTEEARVR
jgi:hypothetical protein